MGGHGNGGGGRHGRGLAALSQSVAALSGDAPLQNRAGGLSRAGPRSQRRGCLDFAGTAVDEVLGILLTVSVGRLLQTISTIVDPALAKRIAAWLDTHPVPPADQRLVAHAREMQDVLATRLAAEPGPVLDTP